MTTEHHSLPGRMTLLTTFETHRARHETGGADRVGQGEIVLDHVIGLMGRDAGGTARVLARVFAGDLAVLGNGTMPIQIETNGFIRTFNGTTASAIARIATGTYTGDGATSQAITGLGFAPKYVMITARQGAGSVWYEVSTDVIVDDDASGAHVRITSSAAIAVNGIIALGADGFTVDDAGTDSAPNTNLQVYNYVAIG